MKRGEMEGYKDRRGGDRRIQRQEEWRQEDTKIGGVEIGGYKDRRSGERRMQGWGETAQGEPENSGKGSRH